MDLFSKKNIKDLLEKRGLRPLKRFGQNFLIDKRALRKIVAAAELTSQDTVLEIGPGIGTLTQELAEKAGKVIAIEKDRNMVDILKETLKDFNNIEVIQADIRKIENLKFLPAGRQGKFKNYKLVGNLPFYLTAPVIRKFLENTGVQPLQMVLVVQKEVGQRICAKPPRPKGARLAPQRRAARMNLLAVSVQFYAEPKIISYISKKSFWPSPEVDAAIIKITPHESRSVLDQLFFKIVKAGFSQPRKQLINNLSRGLKIDKIKVKEWLLENNIQPSQRAETLTVENWINLTKSFKMN